MGDLKTPPESSFLGKSRLPPVSKVRSNMGDSGVRVVSGIDDFSGGTSDFEGGVSYGKGNYSDYPSNPHHNIHSFPTQRGVRGTSIAQQQQQYHNTNQLSNQHNQRSPLQNTVTSNTMFQTNDRQVSRRVTEKQKGHKGEREIEQQKQSTSSFSEKRERSSRTSHNNTERTLFGAYYTGTERRRIAASENNQIQYAHGLSVNLCLDWSFNGEKAATPPNRKQIPPFILSEEYVRAKFHGNDNKSVTKHQTGRGETRGNSKSHGSSQSTRKVQESGYVIGNPSGYNYDIDDPNISSSSSRPQHIHSNRGGREQNEQKGGRHSNTRDERLEHRNRLTNIERSIFLQNKQNNEILVLEVALHSFNNPLPFPVGVFWPGAPLSNTEGTNDADYLFVLPPQCSQILTPPRTHDIRPKLDMEDANLAAIVEKHTNDGMYMKHSGTVNNEEVVVYCDKILYYFIEDLYPNVFTRSLMGDRQIVKVPEVVLQECMSEMFRRISRNQFTKYGKLSFFLSPIISDGNVSSKTQNSDDNGGSVSKAETLLRQQYSMGHGGSIHQEKIEEGWRSWQHLVHVMIEIIYL